MANPNVTVLTFNFHTAFFFRLEGCKLLYCSWQALVSNCG